MTTLYTHKDSNIRKTWLLMSFFFAFVIAIGYGISWYMGDSSIMYGAIIFALLMNVGSYWWSDKLVISMTGAHPLDPHDASHREVERIVENLAITAGLPKPRIFIVDDSSPNAFATGRDPEHAVIAVTSGIVRILEKNELEGVIAHELAHVGNRDMLVSTVAVVLAGFIAMIADLFLRVSVFGGDHRDRNPLVAVIAIVGIILAPIAAQMIHLAISRKREYLADATGAMLTRYPEGLASALEKISTYSRPLQHANHATAHLFIADPFGVNKVGIGEKVMHLFQTHPPIKERIRLLRETL